jgi:hypothetical protein
MKKRFVFSLAGFFFLAYLFCDGSRANDAPVRHSLESDYGFMIGAWTCHVTQAGTPDRDISVEYEWAYSRHVLRENMRLKGRLIGEFFTTYDKATDRFKGAGIGAWGGYVVWENQGFNEGRLNEMGYVFAGGRMTPVSRSEFERVSDTHYLVRDFEVGPDSSKGSATDTEDCVKAK